MSEPGPSSSAPRPPPFFQRWLAEMKRRRVSRVIAVYGATSFVVIEAADVIVPAIPLPEVVISVVFWLLVFGFPIVVALAWTFDVTPDGVKRTAPAAAGEIQSIVAGPARSRWPSGLLALAGLVLLGLAFYGGRRSAVGDVGTDAAGSPVEAADGAAPAFVDPEDDPRSSIAVLAFADMSADGDQEYFSDGISMEIQSMLAKIRDLRVAGRSSAFAYKGQRVDPRQIGGEIGVEFLLDGTVRKDGEQLRISTELVRVSNGVSLWSAQFDRPLDNIFAIQTEIAEAIADSLRVPLGLSQDALVSPTLDMEAHDLYLSGRAALRRRGPGVGEAVELFQAAVDRDSTWAPAWGGLAEAAAIHPLYTGQGGESTDSAVWERSLSLAETAARRALELDPRNASARVALGGVYRDRWQWVQGERELLTALELDPDNSEAHVQYAEVLWGTGRLDESLRETGRALAIDRSPINLDVHGFVMQLNGRADEAEALLEEGIALDVGGDLHFLRTVLADMMLVDGRYQKAIERFTRYLPDPAGYRLMGRALEEQDATLLDEVAGTPRGLLQAWVLLGETDRALDVLEEIVFSMPFRVRYDIWDPVLAPLWDTTRFQDVILPRLRLEGVHPIFAEAGGGG